MSVEFVVRVEVEVLNYSGMYNLHIRDIAKACVKAGYIPMCGISIVYKDDVRHFIDLKVNSTQIDFICCNPIHGRYALDYIGLASENHENFLSGSMSSWFEMYDDSVETSPYNGGQQGLYRDEYSDKVSYAQLAVVA
jgi:hypothetical protein